MILQRFRQQDNNIVNFCVVNQHEDVLGRSSGGMNYVLFKGPNDDGIPFIRSTLAGESLTFFGEYCKKYCQVFDLCFIDNF